jgi:predicted transcriptional regulator
MAKIVWKLDKVLKEIKVSPNKLSVLAQVRPNTIYNMVYNEAGRVHFDTITKVLVALNKIAKDKEIHKKFDIADIMEFID